MSGKHTIYVYGTLKRGYGNNRLLTSSTFLREARLAPKYKLYDVGWFPGLIEAPDNGVAVTGELWEVDDATLRRLDALEGVPFLYDRVFLDVDGAEPGTVQGYIYQNETRSLRELGDTWPGEKAA